MSERGDGWVGDDDTARSVESKGRAFPDDLTPAVRRRSEAATEANPANRERQATQTQNQTKSTQTQNQTEPAQRERPQTRRERESAEFDERVRFAREAIRQDDPRIDPELLLEYTTDRRDLHPSVRIQWSIWTTVGVAIVTMILTSVIPFLGFPPVAGGGIFVVLFAIGMGWIVFRYRLWVYQVQDESLYLERGVFTHRRTHVPYVRIQHVDTSRSPIERWLGLSTLVVYTAGSRGADVSIPGLLPEEARDLQERVKQLAIEAEGGDAL